MTVATPTYGTKLKVEITLCENLIERLKTLLSDANALSERDSRETVTDAIDVALQVLQEDKKEKQYQLDHH